MCVLWVDSVDFVKLETLRIVTLIKIQMNLILFLHSHLIPQKHTSSHCNNDPIHASPNIHDDPRHSLASSPAASSVYIPTTLDTDDSARRTPCSATGTTTATAYMPTGATSTMMHSTTPSRNRLKKMQ